ncbi:PREDICTED: reverse mRNAase [Prunus dulcis]|uniref:PREDICTED: reverse mRNAase n=1 Tax=Prunus dulcis TaxID=3755 RepID=A0A5E4GIZ4_PRUDU|nr:hypothetical protein L3X38_028144 [Prunus dulcis]VVA39837.1 PREDICTED: reverse mRNAase [Prunus dulcis]
MNTSGLVDLGFQEPTFTWRAFRSNQTLIQERTDRGLANTLWMECWPNTCVLHELAVGSDHCPLIVHTTCHSNRYMKLFRFEANWTDDQECHEIKVGKNKRQINSLSRELEGLQLHWEANQNRITQTTSKVNTLWAKEEKYWQQSARVNWLTAGDAKTKFFHMSTIQRRRNRMVCIQDENRVYSSGEHDVRATFDRYFGNLFTTYGPQEMGNVVECVNPVISNAMNMDFLRPIAPQEIKDAVFEIGALKALGPDGFQGIFY